MSVRGVKLALSEGCPYQAEFIAACRALGVAALNMKAHTPARRRP